MMPMARWRGFREDPVANEVVVPMPDPTSATKEVLNREIVSINRELAIRSEIRQREHETLEVYLQSQVDHVKEIMDVRFDSQITLLDERFTTSVKALDAAFSAAALAVGTAQLAADKAVDRERDTSNTKFAALDAKYAELASRMDKTSGQDSGVAISEVSKRFYLAFGLSMISALIAIGALILGVIR